TCRAGLTIPAPSSSARSLKTNSLPSGGQSFGGASSPIKHYKNPRLEWAVSVRDITHRGVMDFAYELPIGKGKWIGQGWNRPTDMLLGGWQLNGIVVMQSGVPLVPNLQSGVLPGATQRPNLLYEPGLPGS